MSQISDFLSVLMVNWYAAVEAGGRIYKCGGWSSDGSWNVPEIDRVWLLDTTARWNELRASRDTLIDDQQIMRKKCSLKNTKLSIWTLGIQVRMKRNILCPIVCWFEGYEGSDVNPMLEF